VRAGVLHTFLLRPGHEQGLKEAEVKERGERFVLVEKVGRMGELVEEQQESPVHDG
jgi:hypothetical protein